MQSKRTLKDAIFLVIKGLGMGAANKVPGVSGGVVAFVAGYIGLLLQSFKEEFHTYQNVISDRLKTERAFDTTQHENIKLWAEQRFTAIDERDSMHDSGNDKKLNSLQAFREDLQRNHIPKMTALESQVQELKDFELRSLEHLQKLEAATNKIDEQLHAIEREMYSNVDYRAGRPFPESTMRVIQDLIQPRPSK